MNKSVRVGVFLPRQVVARIDAIAAYSGATRSSLTACFVEQQFATMGSLLFELELMTDLSDPIRLNFLRKKFHDAAAQSGERVNVLRPRCGGRQPCRSYTND